MSKASLNYRSSGVDINANSEANERIKTLIGTNQDRWVVTRPGLFSGAVRLNQAKALQQPALDGALGYTEEATAATAGPVWQMCCRKLQQGAKPLAFLDYVAASVLIPMKVVSIVRQFSELLSRYPKTSLIGGETAEMPDTFQQGTLEIVGALFGFLDRGDFHSECVDLSTIQHMSEPVLVSSIDGVGTKTKLGIMARKTSTLARDIIHHSLNDILCQGAQGIALMIYIGCHSRDEALIQPIVQSVRQHCSDLNLSLVDLVVTEKPNLYLPGELDICGAVAGLLDAENLIQGEAIQAGDVLIGLASSGLHTNGYSLARRALLDNAGFKLEQYLEELGTTLGETLLEPHKNYAPVVLPILEDDVLGNAVKGLAHITGGGLLENVARILPEGLSAEIQLGSWTPQQIFRLIQRVGNIPERDPVGKGMYETFNMGIGLVIVVEAQRADAVLHRLQKESGEQPIVIGQVVSGSVDTSRSSSGFRKEKVRLQS